MHGNPISSSTSRASFILCAMPERGVSKPIDFMVLSKSSLSSALSMASFFAPINSTPNCSKTPLDAKVKAVFNAVCPPMVGSNASGFSFSIMAATTFQLIGSMYVASAIEGSVMMVAGLEFTKMTLKPSFLSALQA